MKGDNQAQGGNTAFFVSSLLTVYNAIQSQMLCAPLVLDRLRILIRLAERHHAAQCTSLCSAVTRFVSRLVAKGAACDPAADRYKP